MSKFLSPALFVLTLSVIAGFKPAVAQLCPKTCVADAQESEQGAVPPGVTCVLAATNETDGTGTIQCTTCAECSVLISLAFNSGGTYCIYYRSVPTNPWTPLLEGTQGIGNSVTKESTCNDPTPGYVEIKICPKVGGQCTDCQSPDYSKSITLSCSCNI